MKDTLNYTSIDFDPFGKHEFLFAIPTTEPQQEIFASIAMEPRSSCAFNESISIHLKGPLQQAAMKQALDNLVVRHDALRSSFSPDGLLFMVAANNPCEFKQSDWSNDNTQIQNKKIADLLKTEVNTEFDLVHGPLLRAHMVKLQAKQYLFIITGHHIVFDGWSASVFIDEIGQFYNAALNQTQAALPTICQFSQYSIEKNRQKKSPDYQKSEQYWKKLFATEVPVLDLPTDFPRPAHRTFNSHRIDYEIAQDRISQLTRLGAKVGCSLVHTMFASFNLFIYQLTGQHNLVIGMPAAEQSILGKPHLIGHCVNMLPIKSQLQPEQLFIDFLKQEKMNILDAYEHQSVTFGSLIKQLSLKRDPSRIPLIPITFNIDQKIESSELNWQDLEVSFETNPRTYENFELVINASMGDGKFTLEAQYNSNLFKPETITDWLKQFESLLIAIGQNPQATIAQLTDENKKKQTAVLDQINKTAMVYARDKGVHELIQEQALHSPEKIAIRDENSQISYAELDKQSSQLAHYLIQQGVHQQVPIGVCMNRSIQMVIALISIWKTGCPYVPLDPNYPADRLKYMIHNSGMPFILTEDSCAPDIPESEAHLISMDKEQAHIHSMPIDSPELPHFTSQDCAYIIYTSGSTGNPKGVMISHQNAVNFLQSMANRPGLTALDSLLAVTTISFDIAVLELYLPLIIGAQVVLASLETAIDGEKLIADIEQYQITCLQATPMTWRLMLASGWQGNKQLKVLCGGEPFPADLAVSLYDKVHSVWNMYGPTETTVWSTCHQITNPHDPMYIGHPIGNTQVYILDDDLNPVGPGQTGNLYIGGDGLALGYLGAAELTEQKFIPHPFAEDPNERLYNTGDLGRYNQNGLLECLGRNDSQIKLRGFRIELGEIQTALARHEAISQCVIRLVDIQGDPSITAYVILHDNEQLSHSHMRQFVRQKLPEYMIPSHMVIMTDFPKTLNGKIDTKSLPIPSEPSHTINQKTSQDLSSIKLSAAETLLVGIFKDVLAIDEVAVNDNFFELGGHSLLSLKVIQQINQACNNSISPRMMLTDTVEQLALSCEMEEPEIRDSLKSPSQRSIQIQTQSFFFQHQKQSASEEEKQLFGMYYPPVNQGKKNIGVLLLYPIQQEYMRCHWGFKHMAKLLSKQGFPVFKFDYYGTGDSYGESQDFSLEQCLKDIKLAEQEFKLRSGIHSVAIVGLRLGATLAAMYANQNSTKQLILWDPVVQGDSHLKELSSLQQQLLKRIKENAYFFSGIKTKQPQPPNELLGYSISESLYHHIQALDLSQIFNSYDDQHIKQQRTILVTSKVTREIQGLKDQLLSQCSNFSYKIVKDNVNWIDLDQYLNSIIPHQSMNQIISFLAGGGHE